MSKNSIVKQDRFTSVGFLVSAMALAISVTAFVLFVVFTENKADVMSAGGVAEHTRANQNVVDFFAQAIVFVLGGLLGGTLSLVGAVLSVMGLKDKNKPSSWLSLLMAIIGPVILIVGANFI